MAKLQTVSITPQVDADGICASQTPAASGVQSLTLDGALASGGSVTLTAMHNVSVTSAGNDTGRTFSFTGTDWYGRAVTEDVTGASGGTANGTKYFKTVTAVSTDDDTAAAVTVGTKDDAVSPYLSVDNDISPVELSVSVVLSSGASLTYEAQFHSEDTVNASDQSETVFQHNVLNGKTATDFDSIVVPVRGVRVNVTSFTSGTATLKIRQAG